MKKAECRRIDAFELWHWRWCLRVPWTTRISKQSILKEISPECSLVGLTLKLKLQYFGHLMRRADSWKDPDAGKDWGQEEKGMTEDDHWMTSPTRWAWVWVSFRHWWWTGKPSVLQSMWSQRVRHDLVTDLNCSGNFCYMKCIGIFSFWLAIFIIIKCLSLVYLYFWKSCILSYVKIVTLFNFNFLNILAPPLIYLLFWIFFNFFSLYVCVSM